MKKRIITLLMAGLLAGGAITGCGATTADDNTSTYFSQVRTELDILSGKDKSGTGAEADNRKALEAPADFTCDASGSYSFNSVDNADYYVIYMYKNGNTAYDFVSQNITGTGTITGSLADLGYGYGDYKVTCVAYPDYTNEDLKQSDENSATATIKVTGEVAEPQLTFFWDCFADELRIIWLNSGDYAQTDYPRSMDVQMTGDAENDFSVDMDSATTSYVVDGTTAGDTYSMTATVAFNSDYVTNPSFDVDLGSVTCDPDANFAPDGYQYNGGLYQYIDYPIAAENFNLKDGGECGRWKIYTGGGHFMSSASDTAEYVIYTATPTATADGDAYTYTFVAGNDDGSDLYTSPFGAMNHVTGTLHLHADNTFQMEMDAIYITTDKVSNAEQWHNGSTCDGKWFDNGDGTANLSFNLGSETDLGKGVRTTDDASTEATTAAAEAATKTAEQAQ